MADPSASPPVSRLSISQATSDQVHFITLLGIHLPLLLTSCVVPSPLKDAIPGDARWRRGEAVSLKTARDSMVRANQPQYTHFIVLSRAGHATDTHTPPNFVPACTGVAGGCCPQPACVCWAHPRDLCFTPYASSMLLCLPLPSATHPNARVSILAIAVALRPANSRV